MYLRTIAVTAALLSTHVCLQAQSGNTADKASVDRGKIVYEQHCLACHQADGAGVPNLNPPLTKTKWTLGDKNELIKVVLEGLDEEIEVNGETYSNVMPPMSYLSDDEIADVLTFVRNNFGNKASAVKTSEVKVLRDKLK